MSTSQTSTSWAHSILRGPQSTPSINRPLAASDSRMIKDASYLKGVLNLKIQDLRKELLCIKNQIFLFGENEKAAAMNKKCAQQAAQELTKEQETLKITNTALENFYTGMNTTQIREEAAQLKRVNDKTATDNETMFQTRAALQRMIEKTEYEVKHLQETTVNFQTKKLEPSRKIAQNENEFSRLKATLITLMSQRDDLLIKAEGLNFKCHEEELRRTVHKMSLWVQERLQQIGNLIPGIHNDNQLEKMLSEIAPAGGNKSSHSHHLRTIQKYLHQLQAITKVTDEALVLYKAKTLDLKRLSDTFNVCKLENSLDRKKANAIDKKLDIERVMVASSASLCVKKEEFINYERQLNMLEVHKRVQELESRVQELKRENYTINDSLEEDKYLEECKRKALAAISRINQELITSNEKGND